MIAVKITRKAPNRHTVEINGAEVRTTFFEYKRTSVDDTDRLLIEFHVDWLEVTDETDPPPPAKP